MNSLNSYDLSRAWFNYCFDNPEKIRPNHTAMYFFAIEHCNRLGWKRKFGFPTTMVMEAISIKSYNTYIKTLLELVDFGFVKMIERSKNQHSSNIIELSNFNKATTKALDKALIKHSTKQSESTIQSISSIVKQINKEQYNKEQVTKLKDACVLYLNKGKVKTILLSEIKISDDIDENLKITLAFWNLFKNNLEELNISTTTLNKATTKWVTHIKLLILKDGRTHAEIREVFNFLQKDDFWKQNILSTDKLRKQFEKILIKARSNGNSKNKQKQGTTLDELQQVLAKHFD